MGKGLIVLMASVGGMIGGYLPTLLGASGISGWSIIGSFVGGICGIYVGYKMTE